LYPSQVGLVPTKIIGSQGERLPFWATGQPGPVLKGILKITIFLSSKTYSLFSFGNFKK
jgi:hypothetical protein